MRSEISTIFLQQILVIRLLPVFNLNLQLKLLCYPLIKVSNKLSHKICYENIVDIALVVFLLTIFNIQLHKKIKN